MTQDQFSIIYHRSSWVMHTALAQFQLITNPISLSANLITNQPRWVRP